MSSLAGSKLAVYIEAAVDEKEQNDRVTYWPSRAVGLKSALPAIIAAAVSMMLFARSLFGTFAYDDVPLILGDFRIAEPSRWWQYLFQSYNMGIDNLYRPLTSITLALQFWLVGSSAWSFHLVNILLHAGVAACVAELARRLFDQRTGIIAGLLFAVHPIHVEPVCMIVGRAEILCALGSFGALLLCFKPMTVRRAVAITCCVLVAVLSKEQGLFMPPLVALLIWARSTAPFKPTRNVVILMALMGAFILPYLVWRQWLLPFNWDRSQLDWTKNPIALSKGLSRWLLPFSILGRYLLLLLAPVRLSPDYGAAVTGPDFQMADPYFYLGIVAAAAWFVATTISIIHRNKVYTFVLLAIGLLYAMIGNIFVLIGAVLGERLIYIPSGFFVILIARIAAKIPFHIRIAIVGSACLLGAFRTYNYVGLWNDPFELYQTSLKAEPHSIRLIALLAGEFMKRGDLATAAQLTDRGTNLLPNYSKLWVLSGDIARRQGDLPRAKRLYLHALQIDLENDADERLVELDEAAAASTSKPGS